MKIFHWNSSFVLRVFSGSVGQYCRRVYFMILWDTRVSHWALMSPFCGSQMTHSISNFIAWPWKTSPQVTYIEGWSLLLPSNTVLHSTHKSSLLTPNHQKFQRKKNHSKILFLEILCVSLQSACWSTPIPALSFFHSFSVFALMFKIFFFRETPGCLKNLYLGGLRHSIDSI